MPKKSSQKIETVYIANMSEDVWPFIQSMSSLYSRDSEISENADLAEHDLFNFSARENVLIILPKPISRFYFDYFLDLSRAKNIKVLSAKIHTGETCRDILSDKKLYNDLINLIGKDGTVNLISYCVSPQFWILASSLKAKGINIEIPETPKEADSWTVDFYGSKSGIRQLSQQSGAKEPDFQMAPGLISIDIGNTAKIAAKTFIRDKGVVIKTNKGHSGAGVLIFRKNDLPNNYSLCEQKILSFLKQERYWNKFPIIVEKYIEPALTVGNGYPNAEYKIHKNGRVEFLYYCSNRVTPEGVFKGVDIHNSVLSDQLSAQIIDTGFFVGESLSSQGYRGYYDVDFISGKNGEIYVTESNVRRTGGTHVYYLAKHLFGKDFMYGTYIRSNNLYHIKRRTSFSEQKLFEVLKPLLFKRSKGEGIIVTGTRSLQQNNFGYVIFGKTKKSAYSIESNMERLLED